MLFAFFLYPRCRLIPLILILFTPLSREPQSFGLIRPSRSLSDPLEKVHIRRLHHLLHIVSRFDHFLVVEEHPCRFLVGSILLWELFADEGDVVPVCVSYVFLMRARIKELRIRGCRLSSTASMAKPSSGYPLEIMKEKRKETAPTYPA